MNSDFDIGNPGDWGLPSKFRTFRDIQPQAISELADAPTAIRAGNLPTGSGKTLTAFGVDMVLPAKRSAYLTATNGLLNQYMRDGAEIGMTEIKGRRNYGCVLKTFSGKRMDCEQGWAAQCWAKNRPECNFNYAVEGMQEASRVATNYHFWLAYHRAGRSLGPFDLLVCDEAHDLPSILADMSMCFIPFEAASPPEQLQTDMEWWREWAIGELPIELPDPKDDPIGFIRRKKWADTLTMISKSDGTWVADVAQKRGWNMGPMWPAKAARKDLFRGIRHVLLMSATVRPKTMRLLGLDPVTPRQLAREGREPREGESLFLEYPSTYDLSRCPIYYLTDGAIQLKFANRDDPGTLRIWVSLLDAFLRTRQDRKTIIHSVSYAWARIILRYSAFSEMMDTHERAHELPSLLRKFRSSREARILVSPSVTTGFDFPGDECRAQIISKLPFPNNSDIKNLAAARRKEDKQYDAYQIAQTLVQSVGRPMRGEDDWCETIIIDKQFGWFSNKNADLFPAAFMQAVQPVSSIPDGQKFRFHTKE